MSKFGAFLTLIFGVGLGTVMAVPAAPAGDQAKITQLVSQLGSQNFRQREAATKELDAMGEPALDALRKATKSGDMEVANRAAALVAKIEQRAENAKLIAPTYVELNLKETPIEEAVAQLAKQSAYQIIIAGDKSKMADRRVTLETGKVPFWKALGLLCEKADLVESDGIVNPTLPFQPVPPNGQPVPVPFQIQPIQIQPIQIQIQPAPAKPIDVKPMKIEKPAPPAQKPLPPEGFSVQVAPPVKEVPAPVPAVKVQPAVQIAQPAIQIAQPAIQLQPAQPIRRPIIRPQPQPGYNGQMIVLTDGKGKSLPSHVEGAIRIRAITNTNIAANYGPVPEGEIGLLLEAKAEPKMQVQQIVGVKIDKAVDNFDQQLTPSMVTSNTNGGAETQVQILKGGFRQVQIAQPAIGRPYNPGIGYVGNSIVPARLKRGEKESKSIKELRGVVSLKIRTPVEDIAAIENILKAKGESAKGKCSSVMKVLAVNKEENGDIKVEVELQFSNEIQPQVQSKPAQGWPTPTPLPARPIGGNFNIQVQIAPAPAVPPVPPQKPIGGGVGGQGGGMAVPGVMVHNFLGLELVDAKGRSFDLVQMVNTKNMWMGNGRTAVATMTFRPAKDAGDAAKLVFRGTRFADVDVPFLLKDVPVK
jgi:hypothetical protein